MRVLEAMSIFPVLMIAEDDPDSGALNFKPLPLEWPLLWRWLLWWWLPGAAANLAGRLRRRPAAMVRWGVGWSDWLLTRLTLEVQMSAILVNAWREVCGAQPVAFS